MYLIVMHTGSHNHNDIIMLLIVKKRNVVCSYMII